TPAKFFCLAPVAHGGLSGHVWNVKCFGETSESVTMALINRVGKRGIQVKLSSGSMTLMR
ncbi:MAG: hypothetical protein KZQ89_06215, partial [Candidatus Thiodiazotropha sp. (ex Lucinoma kastoroae)]|nr:hypothetical protein [Candidatus Thiodiazotropha sp. (ex Lucinoma kastoroae)]MCU7858489.1 hypothetical protein [Candidatus Thiodiazotropha sp. (ex Lucinoma kastoroae)]